MAYNKLHKPQNNITYNNTYISKSHNIPKENYTTYNKTKKITHINTKKYNI